MFHSSKGKVIFGVSWVVFGHFLLLPAIFFALFVDAEPSPDVLMILQMVMALITTLVFVFLFRDGLAAGIRPLFEKWKTMLWMVPAGWGMSMVGRLIPMLLLIGIFYGGAEALEEGISLGGNQEAVEAMVQQAVWISGVSMVVLAPLWEEIFFTGIIFGALVKRSRLLAYGVTSLAFGLAHTLLPMITDFTPQLILITFIYVPTSLVCCWIYEKTESIWGPILLHAFSNTIAWLLIM